MPVCCSTLRFTSPTVRAPCTRSTRSTVLLLSVAVATSTNTSRSCEFALHEKNEEKTCKPDMQGREMHKVTDREETQSCGRCCASHNRHTCLARCRSSLAARSTAALRAASHAFRCSAISELDFSFQPPGQMQLSPLCFNSAS